MGLEVVLIFSPSVLNMKYLAVQGLKVSFNTLTLSLEMIGQSSLAVGKLPVQGHQTSKLVAELGLEFGSL